LSQASETLTLSGDAPLRIVVCMYTHYVRVVRATYFLAQASNFMKRTNNENGTKNEL